MRRRLAAAVLVELALIALAAGMFGFSVYMKRQERVWREQGTKLNAIEQLCVDVSMWWSQFGPVAAPLVVLGGLGLAGLILVTGGRRLRYNPADEPPALPGR